MTDENEVSVPQPEAVPTPDTTNASDTSVETKEFTCVQCPMGCSLTVTLKDGAVIGVTGNTCPRGKAYGEHEAVAPERVVTSLVGQAGTTRPVSVKTTAPVPKGRIADVLAAIEATVVPEPVGIGDVVVSNVADTGVDVIATRASGWANGGL